MTYYERFIVAGTGLLAALFIYAVLQGRRDAAPMRARFHTPVIVTLPDGTSWSVEHSSGVMCEVKAVVTPEKETP